MERINQKILTEVQRRFPLERRPYKVLGERLGLSEEEIIKRLEQLKEQGILRQIGAIFNPSALGYQTSLVAAAVKEDRLLSAAEIINAYPGVSHNYLRDHQYNLWFTIACPPGRELNTLVDALLKKAQVEDYLLLPIKRVFRIAVVLNFSENGEEAPSGFQNTRPKISPPPDKKTIALVRTTQEDLPRTKYPFSLWAEKVGLSVEELLDWLKKGLEKGLIRRFAGLVKHTRAGFKGNVMVAWRVPQERLDEVGRSLAQEKAVTHCYERVSYPHWPYNLYTMLHASDREEAQKIITGLSQKLGLSDYLPLVTIKELKKIRLKLFWSE